MALPEMESTLKTSNKSANNRTNLLFCLRPTVLVEAKKERPVSFPKVLPTNDISLKEEEEENGSDDLHGKKISGSRRFSRIWKAVLSEPSTGKMIKKGKSDKKSSKSLSTESARYDFNKSKRSKEDFDFDSEHRLVERSASALATSAATNLICPTCSSALTAAKTTSTIELNSVGSNKTSTVNAESQRARVCRSSDCGLLLMLVSLLVLVFWGKLCAVFWTATWLFLVPHWTVDGGRVDFPQPGMFKEKVVMEGFLARERRRVIPCQ